MGLSNPDSVFDDHVTELRRILEELVEKYLVIDLKSNISIHFIEIDLPEPSDLAYRFDDLEKGVRFFLSETLNNGPEPNLFPVPFPPFRRRLLIKHDDAPIAFETNKRLTEEELMKVLADPILKTFQTLEASVYTVTIAGRIKNESLLKPSWCCSMLAVSSENRWFILASDWRD